MVPYHTCIMQSLWIFSIFNLIQRDSSVFPLVSCLQVEALHSVHVCTYEMIQYFNSPKHQGELVKVGTHYATRSMHVYMYNT